MVIRSLGFFIKTLSFVSVILMISITAFFFWVISEPRSLSQITPYIQEKLNDLSVDYKIEIDDSFIKWDGVQKAFSLYVTNVKVVNDTNDKVAIFPKVSFDFSVVRFLKGDILSSDITIINPDFHINSADKKLYVVPNSDKQAGLVLFDELAKILEVGGKKSPIRSVRVRDANFYIHSGVSDILWNITEGYARLDSQNGKNRLVSELKINFGNFESYFHLALSKENFSEINVTTSFKELPSYAFADLFPEINMLKQLEVVSSGELKFLLDNNMHISQLAFDIYNMSGKLNLPEYFKAEIPIDSLKAQGNIYNDFSVLALDSFIVRVNDSEVTLSGSIKNYGDFVEIKPEILFNASLANMNVNDLDKYWPVGLAKKTRRWIVSNISGGKVTNANASFKFTPEVFEKGLKFAPEGSIIASINVEGAQVKYVANYPIITDTKARINLTGRSMEALVKSAKIGKSNIKNGVVTIPNFFEKPFRISVKSDVDGRSSDFIKFLIPTIDKLKGNEAIESIKNMKGRIKGAVSLSLPVAKGLKYSDIDLHIKSKVTGAYLPKFLNELDLNKGNFDFNLDNDKIIVRGKGVLNSVNVDVDYTKYIFGGNDFDAKYRIKSNISADEIRALKIADVPYITQKFKMDLTVTEKNKSKNYSIIADITDSQVKIDEIGFLKPVGVVGGIKFLAEEVGGYFKMDDFVVDGPDYSAKGAMQIDRADNSIKNLKFSSVKFGNNDFKIDYKVGKTRVTLDLEGKSVDIGAIKINRFFKASGSAKKSMDILVDLDHLYMKNGQYLNGLVGNINCSVELCKSVNIYGKMSGDNYVVVSLKPIGDRSSLLIESDNAGVIISGLGISKHIKGGHLNIESTFADSDNKKVARGLIRIRNFTAIKTPLLGKLLSLASLKGIGDLLNNKGITFKKFEAPFTMMDGVLAVKDAKSSGSSVGITSNGTIDTNSGVIDLKGAIVPAYEINKVLGKIPIVGPLLVGGKDEGLIATNYRIKGTYEEAKITVNPLSILTPGFLRNIFDIFP